MNTSYASQGVSVVAIQNGLTVISCEPIFTVPPGMGTIWSLTTESGKVTMYCSSFCCWPD